MSAVARFSPRSPVAGMWLVPGGSAPRAFPQSLVLSPCRGCVNNSFAAPRNRVRQLRVQLKCRLVHHSEWIVNTDGCRSNSNTRIAKQPASVRVGGITRSNSSRNSIACHGWGSGQK
jgi:hypothetical protein